MLDSENSEGKKTSLYLHLPFTTIVRVFAALIFICCLKVLAPLLMTLFLATLLAVSLVPIVKWLQKKKFPRWLAVTILTITLGVSIIAVAAVILPRLFQELSNFIENMPKFKEQVLGFLAETNPLRPFIEHNLSKQAVTLKPTDIAPIFSAGNIALGGLTEVILIFAFTIYLIIDGAGVVRWFSAFFSSSTQAKIEETTDQVSVIIFSYVTGQFITSIISFFYVLIVLSALHIPSALLLAVLAGIFDVLPVLGFFLAVIPAMLFALPVSGTTAIMVLFLYILYHAVENYFIVPAIYGNRLRVSTFIVLVSLIAAGMLAGVEGAIAILPIVASYPIIERIWLKRYIGKTVIDQHAKANAEGNSK